MGDPYVYEGTDTLINKFNVKDKDALSEIEGVVFYLKNHEPLPSGSFDYEHLKAIHQHFFHELYEWAGEERTVEIAKGDSFFAYHQHITPSLNKLFSKLKDDQYLIKLPLQEFCSKLSYYFNEVNAVHAFREGNGRTQRAFCTLLAENAGYQLNWDRVSEKEYLNASISGFLQANYDPMTSIFEEIATPIRINQIALSEPAQLTVASTEKLKTYVGKQVELTQLIQQKYEHLSKDPELAKVLGQHVLMLGNEVKELAMELADLEDSQLILKSYSNKPYVISLEKRGGFADIHKRFEKNQLETQDVVTVLRFARSQAARLQSSQQQTHARGGHKVPV